MARKVVLPEGPKRWLVHAVKNPTDHWEYDACDYQMSQYQSKTKKRHCPGYLWMHYEPIGYEDNHEGGRVPLETDEVIQKHLDERRKLFILRFRNDWLGHQESQMKGHELWTNLVQTFPKLYAV